jgi:hypothetical protein
MLNVLMFMIVFIVVAMMWQEGLWSNALTFVNVVLAALLATNYFEPTADFFEGYAPSYTYLWDLIAIWTLFFVIFCILRAVTDTISRHRVRFKMPVEMIGRVVFAVLTAAAIVGFFSMSLHTAPLARTAVKGGFQKQPMSGNFLGLAPGRKWLALVQSRSRGPLSQADETATGTNGVREFDPQSEFVIKYGQRRQDLHDHMDTTGTWRVNPRRGDPNLDRYR